MDAPMLPDNPGLVKCPHCRSAVWIHELEMVDEVEQFDTMNTSAEEPLPLELEDYACSDRRFSPNTAPLSASQRLSIPSHYLSQ